MNWLAGWLVHWLDGGLVGCWLVNSGSLAHRLLHALLGWLIGWLPHSLLVGQFVDCKLWLSD